jgi:hypothetical protein
MNSDLEQAMNPHDFRPVLRILYAGPECWSVRWGEPERSRWSAWKADADARLAPVLLARFPVWRADQRTPRPVTIRATPHGVVRSISEPSVRDFIRVFRSVYPSTVLTGHRLHRFADLERPDRVAPEALDRAARVAGL